MSGIKKLSASGKSLAYGNSDPCNGANKWGEGVKEVNWPSQKIKPTPVTAKPVPLSDGQTAIVGNTGRTSAMLG